MYNARFNPNNTELPREAQLIDHGLKRHPGKEVVQLVCRRQHINSTETLGASDLSVQGGSPKGSLAWVRRRG